MSTSRVSAPKPLRELPDIPGIVQRMLQRVPREHQPILLAQRERVSAQRYRDWADVATGVARRSAFLACAEREEEIARRAEGLFPDVAIILSGILAKHPDLATITGPLYSRHALDKQFVMHARAERFGAAAWRSFAEDAQKPGPRAVYLACALLEEESAVFLESISR